MQTGHFDPCPWAAFAGSDELSSWLFGYELFRRNSRFPLAGGRFGCRFGHRFDRSWPIGRALRQTCVVGVTFCAFPDRPPNEDRDKMQANHISMPLGVVIRKSPAVTRWAKWNWEVVAVLPGSTIADWRELRRDGDTVEYHAATVDLELWRGETEAYLTGLSSRIPVIYVVLREARDAEAAQDIEVLMATASPYEAQDYEESGEEIVGTVPMPDGVNAWIRAFIETHHEEEVFVKRKRNKKRVDQAETGVGDARVSQMTDVYRAPTQTKPETIH